MSELNNYFNERRKQIMINTKDVVGILSKPITQKTVEKALVTQLTELYGDTLAQDLLDNCNLCKNSYARTTDYVPIYFIISYPDGNSYGKHFDITCDSYKKEDWKDEYYVHTLNVRTNNKWVGLKDKNAVLHDIFTCLVKSISAMQLVTLICILASKQHYNIVASNWVFQQSLYDTAYQYNNDIYSRINSFASNHLHDYCNFILLNQKELPAYFAKDTNKLATMIGCTLNDEVSLDLNNAKEKLAVDTLIKWGNQFKQMDSSNLAYFLAGQGQNYSCQLNIKFLPTVLSEVVSHFYGGEKDFTNIVKENHGNVFPFTFVVSDKQDIDDLIDQLLSERDFLINTKFLMQKTKMSIVTKGYEQVLQDWLKTAKEHSNTKICQKIIQIVNQVFNYHD